MLHKPKHYLNKRSLLVLYNSFIHTYTNYGNIAWESTNRTNLEKISSLQKHAIRIIHCKDRFTHARELFQESEMLNVFQLNISNNLVSVHKIKSQTAPKIFQNKLIKPTHNYPTNFSLPTSVYHHLNQASLNTGFQSEVPYYQKTFLQTLRNSKKVQPFLKILWEKSFWNLKMKHRIFSWNTGSSSQAVFFEKVFFKLLVFP